jgi:hypothetical protein
MAESFRVYHHLKTVSHISPITVVHATDLYRVLARFKLFAPEMTQRQLHQFISAVKSEDYKTTLGRGLQNFCTKVRKYCTMYEPNYAC